jgi:uncharacterized protein (DUF1015 family)
MISLRPFRAWRPVPDKAHLVGSRSYVSYDPEQLAEKLEGNPYTYLHIIHPDGMKPEELSRSERFGRVRQAFKEFCVEGILVRDEVPGIYVYEQSAKGMLSRGIVVGVSVEDYRAGRIKVHEHTLTARENLFAEYLGHTGVNAEPVLLADPSGDAWQHLLDPVFGTRPEYDFSTTDKVRHRLWAVSDVDWRVRLQKAFSEVPALYIADGHHRMASSARLAEANGATDVSPESWCLAFIVPQTQLYIRNFDRVVSDLGDLDETGLLAALSSIGTLETVEKPHTKHGSIAVRTTSGWHVLHLPKADTTLPPAEQLDCARLSELVLGPVLGIADLRTDARVSFVPGTEGTKYLDRLVESGKAAVAFHLHPVEFAELKAVSDTGGIMPPKSTYIEPKLRSGLTVYSLEEV